MARRNALQLTEVFIFISCGLVLVSNGQECFPNPEHLRSLVDHSPIVLVGRVDEIRPSASQPDDSGLFDAIISHVNVFKGPVDGGSQERIVVGPFGASGSAQICVGEARNIGDVLVLFLSASGDESAEVGALRHFRLVANPVVADEMNRKMVKEHAAPSRRVAHTTNCIEPDHCRNGGSCYFNPALGKSYCKCPPGFKGKACQRDMARLNATKTRAPPSRRDSLTANCSDSEHCINGGSCYFATAIGRSYCKCPEGFEGSRCEEKVTILTRLNAIERHDLHRCSTTRCSARQRRMISSTWSKIGVQTDSAKVVSLSAGADSDDDHSNGGGKLLTNVATSNDNARLLRPQKPQDVREPGLHRGRTGLNGPLKTGDHPVPVESSRSVVSASL